MILIAHVLSYQLPLIWFIRLNVMKGYSTALMGVAAELMRGQCGKNVRSKSIEGMSVTYFENESVESKLSSFISRYSIGGIHVI